MLHILWMILKIILIIIGILLGLVLLALLLVLFCPVRYRAQAEKATPSFSETKVEASVSWLFRLIRVKVFFQNGNTSTDVRVFGIPILKLLKKRGKGSPEKGEAGERNTGQLKKPEPVEITEQTIKPETEDLGTGETAGLPESEKKPESTAPEVTAEKTESFRSKGNTGVPPSEKQRAEDPPHAEKVSVAYRLGNKIRPVWEKIIGIPRKIAGSIRKIALSIRAVYDKIDWWKQFLTHPRIKEAFAYVKQRVFRVIRHVLPTKIRGEITFGSEDPSVTGTVLAVLGMTIPFHKNYVMVSPVFQSENILEGNVWLKGRVYGIVLVKAALEIYFNKNVKYVIYRWKKHKEG